MRAQGSGGPTFSDANWTVLGEGLNGEADALAVSVSDLYAGGTFTTAGGSPANQIAKWDGNSWSPLGSGVNDYVFALGVAGSDVYAAGFFSKAGGTVANYIAKWDGSNWSAMGSGVGRNPPPGYVAALAVSESDLYAGGSFTTAGGKVSPYIARAYLPALPALSVLRSDTQVMVSWPSVDTAGFALEQASTLATPAGWVTAAGITDDGTNKSVTIPGTNRAQFFRLRRL